MILKVAPKQSEARFVVEERNRLNTDMVCKGLLLYGKSQYKLNTAFCKQYVLDHTIGDDNGILFEIKLPTPPKVLAEKKLYTTK